MRIGRRCRAGRYPGTESARAADSRGSEAQTVGVRLDVSTVRAAAYAVAVAAACVSSAAVSRGGAGADFVQFLAPLSLLLAWWLPERRPLILAGAIAIIGAGVADDGAVGVSVAGLAFLGVAEDRRARPWRVALGGGLAGGILAAGLRGDPAGLFGVLGSVAVGGGAALLLRYWERTSELTSETRELRSKAAWLEQRTALARELHDVVGHQVTAIVVQAEAGQVADPQRALERIAGLGRTALTELDRLVVHLRDPRQEVAVSAPPRLLDIDELLAVPLRESGVDVKVRIGDGLDLADADVLAVYRMTQEALTNIARHAGARCAWVDLQRTGDRVRLRVSDDGVGPAIPAGEPARGLGLVGIAERAAAYGGTAELLSRPGGGSTLDVVLVVPTVSRRAR